MMKDIEIKISRETRMVDLSKTTIGNDGENLQGNLVFSFTDDFVKGQGRLEYVINGESKYAFLLSNDENYYIPIKSVMTKEGQIDMQLVITEGTDLNEIPIFKSNVFYVSCKKSINAEVKEEKEYYSWIEIANTKLNEIDEVVEDIETKLANGEFNGKDGVDGKDGKDFTYEDFTEEQLENLRGPQGVPGEPGADGKDYVLTEADKEEIADNINEENNDRITETEKDIVDLETYLDTITPKSSAKGELVHITDALNLPTFETKTSGNVKQETTTGKQLFNYKDTVNVSSGVTVDEDGWITVVYDNTEGTTTKYPNYWTKNLNLKTSTAYAVFAEIKSVSGTGTFLPVTKNYAIPQTQGQFNLEAPFKFTALSNNVIKMVTPTTIEDFSNVVYGLRTMCSFAPGEKGSITFRLSVIEDTTVTPETFVYEPYTGGQASPNPEYPQEIEVIEGNVGIKVNGKNRLPNIKDITREFFGITASVINNEISVVGTATGNGGRLNALLNFNLPAGSYKFGLTNSVQSNVALSNTSTSTVITTTTGNYVKFTLSEETQITLGVNVIENTTHNDKFKAMIVDSDITDYTYEPYQEQIVPLDLKGNWVGAINDTIKDYLVTDKKRFWLVKNVGKVVLDGSEKYADVSIRTNTIRVAIALQGVSYSAITSHLIMKYHIYNSDIEGQMLENNYLVLSLPISVVGNTLNSLKTWLSNNNIEVYYQLAEPYTEYLGELPEPIKTFEGVNNIQLLANLDTEIEVTYALDVKKYFENKLASIQEQIL